MSDSISRQAALDIFDDYNVAVENGQIEAYSRDRKRLCDLPPAQPELCEDAVSREAVIDCVRQDCFAVFTANERVCEIKDLPPITPKQRTGKCMWCERLKERNLRIEYYWIDEEGCTASFSEPHIVATGIAKFCPNCGAKITEGDAE